MRFTDRFRSHRIEQPARPKEPTAAEPLGGSSGGTGTTRRVVESGGSDAARGVGPNVAASADPGVVGGGSGVARGGSGVAEGGSGVAGGGSGVTEGGSGVAEGTSARPGRGSSAGNMLPGRERRRFGIERLAVRLIATCGVIGIGVVLGAILVSSNVQGWITGLAVAAVSVVLSAVLWSSRQL